MLDVSGTGVPLIDRFGAYYNPANKKVELLAQLKTSSLEWTTILLGLLTDFWVSPGVPSYTSALAFFVDIANNVAALPGTGEDHLVFTHSFDVAKFVAALTTLPAGSWKNESLVQGDRLTTKELVKVAEQVKGTDFKVSYDSLEVLKSGKVTELPSHVAAYPSFPKPALQGFLATFGRAVVEHVFDVDRRAETLSLQETFPDIKARSVKELITASVNA